MEIGSVHDGSFGNAKKAIEFGASIGVDAIKFQLHIADAETTSYAPNPEYFKMKADRNISANKFLFSSMAKPF